MDRVRLVLVCLLWCLVGEGQSQSASNTSCSEVIGNLDGYLIDLDGTLYEPQGLIEGAQEFFDYLKDNGVPYVFLSNSGAKGAEGVRAKFMTPPFNISKDPIPLSNIYTAATAASNFVIANCPPGSFIYVLQSISTVGGVDYFIRVLNRTASPSLFNTWTLRTDLSETEVKEWAVMAQTDAAPVFVIASFDGDVEDFGDPVTGKKGYTTWTFDLLSKVGWLIQNGATYLNAAPDTHNAVYDSKFPGLNLETPGPGTFEKLFSSSVYPKAMDMMYDSGKGGNVGSKYMMEPARKLLVAQGASGIKSRIAMVGDTLNTDIKAAIDFDIKSIFVLSGVHQPSDYPYYPGLRPDCVLDNVGDIPKFAMKYQYQQQTVDKPKGKFSA
eukprot:CAMPEP_0174257686 /NCGR_PEP_ID=MMETSP0439-20130205/6800_1 /TAXON_ID=0 /ORGANISM="Stereomyxa ramosa, Strain Chinc5" /LENGTH=381 /DNA_ID=CAMNT_0015340883 /DNA_START=12 /DNA_END=1157 /DNA_ORIENTATION=+